MAYDTLPEPCAPIQLGQFFLEDRRHPAVYFLYHEGTVVYVGQSRTLKWRIDCHMAEAVKEFDAVAFIRCTIDQLLSIEGQYIRKLAPRYNACLLANGVRSRKPWRYLSSGASKLNVDEAAAYLGVSTSDILQWRDDGLIQKDLRARRDRRRVACWNWSANALNKFRDEHPELLTAAKQAA